MKALFFVGRWLRRLLVAGVIVALTLLLARAWQSRGLPDLKPWHTTVLRSELHARDLGPEVTLADYLAREETLFRELREKIFDRLPAGERVNTSRYTAKGQLDPATFTYDWNRTFQMEPETLRGGVLLVHGLTDAPYSMRAVGEIFRGRGFYALGLRMPGHGTVPAALTDAVWEDWMAAVRLGVRAVRARIGPEAVDRPLDLRWPEKVFSLSHVALPFAMSDPLYGLFPDLRESFGVRLGLMVPRGERDVLLLSSDAVTRLYSNPFFPYVEERLLEWTASAGAAPR